MIMAKIPEKEEIRKAVNDYCAQLGLSKSKLSTKIGVSGATLSKIENGEWESIDDKLWQKIWFEIMPPENNLTIIETNNFSTIHGICEKAQEKHFMIGITGDTGLGKTTSLEYYARRKNVYYIVYDKTLKPRQFFVALLKEMSIQFEGNINEMVNRISEELNSQPNPLLIIDEAGKIGHTMILYLHVLRDKTSKNCGIVLAGMPYFKSNLIKFSNKQKEGYAEFNRRVNMWVELKRPTRNEVKALCEVNGIQDADTLEEMFKHRDFGSLQNAIIFNNLLLTI